MRLYLAAAVLMLASVACADAQEETMSEKLATFGQRVTDISQGLVEKAKTHFDDLQTSEFAVNTKNWFVEKFSKMKESFQTEN
ncbi:apolipoprotein C-I [Scophthalmus maximus]|uniref:Apolipoprotein C-I n=1 Tax=Scophthalmus maximus TaxID=52904 RepID=A0A8D3A0A4_SCOMX|nr:apolipoprotein C-I [Scophthalmus maximus]